MKKIVLGTLAHVDAGKTTLSESLLFQTSTIRNLGRVDHQNSFLDFNNQERKRGITIYLKQAMFVHHNTEFTLLDTPGHVDFSAEMERTLKVLDYAILVISATDKVQAHTKTIWKLLKNYHIPTFIFINKMDLSYQTKDEIHEILKTQLDERCIDFSSLDSEVENIAIQDESLLNHYLSTSTLEIPHIQDAINRRLIFPCFYGSALKNEGISDLLDALDIYTTAVKYSSDFKARVFKITRDNLGNRLAHLKITGGVLKSKTKVNNEKVDQIRLYNGDKFTMVNEISAGSICCVKGLNNVHVDDGLGFEQTLEKTYLEPCLNYTLKFEDHSDPFMAYRLLMQLQEEDPQLKINYHYSTNEITVLLMGEIQIEILTQTILERFQMRVSFINGKINYKETLLKPVEGIGHFEPLRHYAEVHLYLEPLARNSGIVIESTCPYDVLNANFQSQILNTLDHNELLGILTNSPITDIKITLLSGKSHLKHTDQNDFKEATLRAFRQGLRKSECLLLEPMFEFEILLDSKHTSRAMVDLDTMNATYRIEQENNFTKLVGTAAVSKLQNYQSILNTYTKGTGMITTILGGYDECHNAQEVIESINYNIDSDIHNSADSVFCTHGSSFIVRWNEVENHMHIPYQVMQKEARVENAPTLIKRYQVSDDELKSVMNRTYKQKEKPQERIKVQIKEMPEFIEVIKQEKLESCLLVDGYNMIHSWDSLKELAKDDLGAARDKLIHLLANYHGTKKSPLLLVFDAYKVLDNSGETIKNGNIHIIYTKTAQTADSYIEAATKKLAKQFTVTVATSDALEQLIILGQGALRLSSKELENKVKLTSKNHREFQKITEKNLPLKQLKDYFNEDK